MKTILSHANLIDCVEPKVRPDTGVLIEDGRIRAILPNAEARCAGAHHFMDVAWKRAFDSGQHVGPRLFASGYFLTTTGGHFLTSGHALAVDVPYGWVKAIREQIKNGVDHIKLNLSGGIMGPAWDPPHPLIPA